MVELAPHQLDAVRRLHNGSILCGGVGSGKSRTALAYYYTRVCDGAIPINGNGIFQSMKNPRNLYIITTARKRDTLEWQGECIQFGLSSDSSLNDNGISVIVDSWNNIGKYTGVVGAFFIFDEQRVVGSGAWVKGFIAVCKKNKWILLSATPGDTWMDYIPIFLANGFYKNRTEFIREHVVFNPYVKWPQVQRYLGVQKLIHYRDSILVNMEFKRHTEMHYIDICVDYDKTLYDKTQSLRWNPYEHQPIINASGYCSVLRKITNTSNSRIDKTLEIMRSNPKLIVFYNFDYELDILKQLCESNSIIYSEWNGHKHCPIPKSESWAYLVQYAAGAEGWNCIETNSILFYSSSYSYKISIQAAGRIDRFNTPFTDLYVFRLYSESSIDQAIKACLKEKRDFNEKAFEQRYLKYQNI